MIGYAGAFLGGVFTLLSPCSALLLPAFFAYAFQSRTVLLARTVVFYLGLAAVLVPLGIASAQASPVVFGHQELLGLAAGLLLIGFGLLQILGRGVDIGPLTRLRGRMRGDSAVSVLALGAVSGLAGFCTGPILGAVLTVAATSGQALRGGVLLAVYAAGMTAPLFVLAVLWDRFDLGRRRWLRGRSVTLGRLRLHSTSLISGTLFITLGFLLLVSGGTTLSGLPALPASTADRLQVLALRVQHLVPDLVVITAIGVLAVLVIWRRLAGTAKSADASSDTAGQRP